MPATTRAGMQSEHSHVQAHSARAAGQAVRTLTAALVGKSANLHDLDAGTFSGAQAADVAALFSAVGKALESPFPAARAAALRTVVAALRGLPPHLAAGHLLPLTRRLLALHRASLASPSPPVLLAIAACAAAAGPLRACSKDSESVCSALVGTALAHVAGILSATAPVRHDAPALGPVLCVALACVTVTSLVRPRIPMLMALVNEAGFQSSQPSVRSTAVALAARLLGSRSLNARPLEAAALISQTCDRIFDIVAVFSSFTEHPSSVSEVDPLLQTLDSRALLYRFSSLCSLLTAVCAQPFAHTIEVPVSRVVSALTDAIELSGIDSMVTSSLHPALEAEDAVAILPGIHEAALATLAAFLRVVQMGAALPCFSSAAESISSSLLNYAPIPASEGAELVQVRMRKALYTAVADLTVLFSAPAVIQLAHPFSIAFAADMELYARLRSARRSAWTSERPDDNGISSGGNSRKRRRAQGRGDTGAASQTLVASLSGHHSTPSEDTLRLFDEGISSGLRAATAMFRAGAIPDPSVSSALRSIERSIAEAVSIREARTLSISALAAAMQGAGSNSASHRATPLFDSAVIAVPLLEHAGFEPDTDPCAVSNAKAALEALLHPRGPPLVRVRDMTPMEHFREPRTVFSQPSAVTGTRDGAKFPTDVQMNGVAESSEVGTKEPNNLDHAVTQPGSEPKDLEGNTTIPAALETMTKGIAASANVAGNMPMDVDQGMQQDPQDTQITPSTNAEETEMKDDVMQSGKTVRFLDTPESILKESGGDPKTQGNVDADSGDPNDRETPSSMDVNEEDEEGEEDDVDEVLKSLRGVESDEE